MNLSVIDLGLISFKDAYSRQLQIHNQVLKGNSAHTLILCEHPHTITLSRKAALANILDNSFILDKTIDLITGVDRGGDITYHGPGQLMGYLIFDLRKLGRDLGIFLGTMEEVIIKTLSIFNLYGHKKFGFRGVWINERKIASIGIGVKKWVSLHGFGLNVNTDLRFFEMIRPCGMDIKMTSMDEILGGHIDLSLVKKELIKELNDCFELKKDQMKTQLTERSECKLHV